MAWLLRCKQLGPRESSVAYLRSDRALPCSVAFICIHARLYVMLFAHSMTTLQLSGWLYRTASNFFALKWVAQLVETHAGLRTIRRIQSCLIFMMHLVRCEVLSSQSRPSLSACLRMEAVNSLYECAQVPL